MAQLDYDINRPWLTLDDWQKKYIETRDKNCFLLCGRQSGKSTAMSIKIAECAISEKEAGDYLVIALTEKQAYALFFKTLMYLETRYPNYIKRGKDKPTMHEINLKNGVCIACHACGNTGAGLRGYTLRRLFIDEGATMNREIFTAITPMLSVTGGKLDIASTPAGKQGYFYECSLRDDFEKFYVSAEDCPRHDKTFLESEKKTMSNLQYSQEYLAVFLSDLMRLFPENLIKKCCVLKRPERIDKTQKTYLGVDVARLGGDKIVFSIVRKIDNKNFLQVENIVDDNKLLTWTHDKIVQLEELYKFREINIDAEAGSMGVVLLDFLKREPKLMGKVKAINNRKMMLDRDGEKTQKLWKEDLYMRLLNLMESGQIKLLDDDEIIASLSSVQYEYVIKEEQPTKLRIFGNYTHSAEGIIRAVWGASEDKSLNIFAY